MKPFWIGCAAFFLILLVSISPNVNAVTTNFINPDQLKPSEPSLSSAIYWTDCLSMGSACLPKVDRGDPVLPEAKPTLFDIFVDDDSNYLDEKGATFEIGDESKPIFFKIKTQATKKNERLSVYLVPVNERYGHRLCSYQFQSDNPFVTVVKFRCPVLGPKKRKTFPHEPGEYRVYVAIEDENYKTITRGFPARYWGRTNLAYKIVLTGDQPAKPTPTPVAPPSNTTNTGNVLDPSSWGAKYQVSYSILVRDFDKLEEKTESYTKEFTEIPSSWPSFFPTNTEYDPSLDVRLVKLGLSIFDEQGKALCTSFVEDENGLLGLMDKFGIPISQAKSCAPHDSPTGLDCAAPNSNNVVSLDYCTLVPEKADSGIYGMLATLAEFTFAAGLTNDGKPMDRPGIDEAYANGRKEALPAVSIKVNYDDLVFDSKNLKGELKVISRDKIAEKAATIDKADWWNGKKTPQIFFKVLPEASACLTVADRFEKASKSGNVYSLKVTYDPLCGFCKDGGFKAIEVNVPGMMSKPVQVPAKIPCQAENLVVTSNKLKLSSVNDELKKYVTEHPYVTRFVILTDPDFYSNFGLTSVLLPEDPTSEEYMQAMDKVRLGTKAQQVVILGDESVLPLGEVQVSDNSKVNSDDAYGMLFGSKQLAVPVGRIQGFEGDDATDTTSLKKAMQQTMEALKPLTNYRENFIVGPADEKDGWNPYPDEVNKLRQFSENYFLDGKACKDHAKECLMAPPFCLYGLGEAAIGCDLSNDGYIQKIKDAKMLSLISNHVLDKEVSVKDQAGTQYDLLYDKTPTGKFDFPPYTLSSDAIVFVGGQEDWKSLPFTIGKGAGALVSVRDTSYEPKAYASLGESLSPKKIFSPYVSYPLGTALKKAKEALLEIYGKNSKNPYMLSLSGDPAISLIPNPENIKPTPAPVAKKATLNTQSNINSISAKPGEEVELTIQIPAGSTRCTSGLIIANQVLKNQAEQLINGEKFHFNAPDSTGTYTITCADIPIAPGATTGDTEYGKLTVQPAGNAN
ncbi:hypothetical protein KJ765_00965 [Candidatus Micrarchaeota archaeon]|nr:hypothetical protein [Candidatus Micrarchaeota archaeon]